MNRERISRNDPCPCGSGRKFKKCCYHKDRTLTQLDRAMAIESLEQHAANCCERYEARDVFCGGLEADVSAMTGHFREVSDAAFLFWFAFDYRRDDGSCLVDRVLNDQTIMSSGERRYLEQMRATAMLPYEVLAVRPGVSVILRRLGAEEEIEVLEKSASKTLTRWDLMVARLNPLGPTGGPEIEMGAMLIAPTAKETIAETFYRELDKREGCDDAAFRFKHLGAVFHAIWLETILAPRIPLPVTAEGDPITIVTMRFDVLDEEQTRAALNAEPDLRCEGERWNWVADGSLLGTIEIAGSQLTVQNAVGTAGRTDTQPRREDRTRRGRVPGLGPDGP